MADMTPDLSLPSVRRRPMSPGRVVAAVLLALGAVMMVTPFLWQVNLSLQTLGESQRIPPAFWPESPQWVNYRKVFTVLPAFPQMVVNTAIVSLVKATLSTLIALMTGYAFARLRFPGRQFLFGLFLSLMMIPGALFLLPQYEIMIKLGWLNTLRGLIAPGLVNVFSIFLVRQFFMQVPTELEESARIDGASVGRIFTHVMVPLGIPVITTVWILALLAAWNDLLWPLIVNNDPNKFVVSVGLASLKGQYSTDVLTTMAAATLATIPILVMFLILQKRIITGIALNAGLKG